jgi:hypothetical protein
VSLLNLYHDQKSTASPEEDETLTEEQDSLRNLVAQSAPERRNGDEARRSSASTATSSGTNKHSPKDAGKDFDVPDIHYEVEEYEVEEEDERPLIQRPVKTRFTIDLSDSEASMDEDYDALSDD